MARVARRQVRQIPPSGRFRIPNVQHYAAGSRMSQGRSSFHGQIDAHLLYPRFDFRVQQRLLHTHHCPPVCCQISRTTNPKQPRKISAIKIAFQHLISSPPDLYGGLLPSLLPFLEGITLSLPTRVLGLIPDSIGTKSPNQMVPNSKQEVKANVSECK